MTRNDFYAYEAAVAVFVGAMLLHAPMYVPTCCAVATRAVLRALAANEKTA